MDYETRLDRAREAYNRSVREFCAAFRDAADDIDTDIDIRNTPEYRALEAAHDAYCAAEWEAVDAREFGSVVGEIARDFSAWTRGWYPYNRNR